MIGKVFSLVGGVVLMLSCQTDDYSSGTGQLVQFRCEGLEVENQATAKGNGPRKAASLSDGGCTDLYVWEGTTLLAHQTSTDTDFGEPTVSLSVGDHDITFTGSKSDGQAWSEGVWSCTKMQDTFCKVMTLTVTEGMGSQSVVLSRRSAKVKWTIEDAIPEKAKTMTISIADNCLSLDAALAGGSKGTYTTEVDISGKAGKTGYAPYVMFMPESKEGSTVAAKITMKDASGNTICEYSNDVTVVPNQTVNIHGDFFKESSKAAVSVTADWGSTVEYDI